MKDAQLIARWTAQFNNKNADGIDFVSSNERDATGKPLGQIYQSYTKEEFFALDDYAYPRSHYVFWRKFFGEKCYIT